MGHNRAFSAVFGAICRSILLQKTSLLSLPGSQSATPSSTVNGSGNGNGNINDDSPGSNIGSGVITNNTTSSGMNAVNRLNSLRSLQLTVNQRQLKLQAALRLLQLIHVFAECLQVL